jgi:hypothetical protein
MNNMTCEAKKVDGRWVCYAEKCPHRIEGGGCQLNKATVTCDNNDCRWNMELAPGVYGCRTMDIHLDADGKCLSYQSIGGEVNAAQTEGEGIQGNNPAVPTAGGGKED